MPWVVYDPKEKDYLCVEQSDAGGELWDTDRTKATRFLTEEEAQMAFDDIDVEDWLQHIKPLYIEDPVPPKKRWEEMTFDEKMVQIEEDFEVTLAERVQRKMLRSKEKWQEQSSLVQSIKEIAKDLHIPLAATQQKPMGKDIWEDPSDDKVVAIDYSALEMRVLKGAQDERRKQKGSVFTLHGSGRCSNSSGSGGGDSDSRSGDGRPGRGGGRR